MKKMSLVLLVILALNSSVALAGENKDALSAEAAKVQSNQKAILYSEILVAASAGTGALFIDHKSLPQTKKELDQLKLPFKAASKSSGVAIIIARDGKKEIIEALPVMRRQGALERLLADGVSRYQDERLDNLKYDIKELKLYSRILKAVSALPLADIALKTTLYSNKDIGFIAIDDAFRDSVSKINDAISAKQNPKPEATRGLADDTMADTTIVK